MHFVWTVLSLFVCLTLVWPWVDQRIQLQKHVALCYNKDRKGTVFPKSQLICPSAKQPYGTLCFAGKKTGLLNELSKSGRPKKSSPKEDRIIHRMSAKDRKLTAVDIHSRMEGQFGSKISVHTVRRRLIMFGLHGRAPRSKPDVSKKK